MDLDILARVWNVDKNIKYHRYTLFYELIFGRIRESCKKVLEIGIASGRSLKLWREYFPNAEVYGIDINPKSISDSERIHCLLGDQSSTDDLNRMKAELGDNFDVIIDDGSHKPEDQATTARCYLDILKDGGFYIIEDVANPSKLEELLSDFLIIEIITSHWQSSRLFLVQKW